MGFSRQEYWSGLPCPPPGDLPNSGIEPTSPKSPAVAGRFCTTGTTWEAPIPPVGMGKENILRETEGVYACVNFFFFLCERETERDRDRKMERERVPGKVKPGREQVGFETAATQNVKGNNEFKKQTTH